MDTIYLMVFWYTAGKVKAQSKRFEPSQFAEAFSFAIGHNGDMYDCTSLGYYKLYSGNATA